MHYCVLRWSTLHCCAEEFIAFKWQYTVHCTLYWVQCSVLFQHLALTNNQPNSLCCELHSRAVIQSAQACQKKVVQCISSQFSTVHFQYTHTYCFSAVHCIFVHCTVGGFIEHALYTPRMGSGSPSAVWGSLPLMTPIIDLCNTALKINVIEWGKGNIVRPQLRKSAKTIWCQVSFLCCNYDKISYYGLKSKSASDHRRQQMNV